MLFHPVQQDVTLGLIGSFIVIIIFVFIGLLVGVFVAWRYWEKGVWGVLPRLVGFGVGCYFLSSATRNILVAMSYHFPDVIFRSGIYICLGAAAIGIGNEVADRKTDKKNSWPRFLKGSFWVIANSFAALISLFTLWKLDKYDTNFAPVIWLTVFIFQWLLIRQVIPISPWWIASSILLSLEQFIHIPVIYDWEFLIFGILAAVLQWYLLKKHNPLGAIWFVFATLAGWIIFGKLFYYLSRLSQIGMVIIWSSMLVGVVATRFIRPVDNIPDEKFTIGDNPLE